jgi:predicted transcriptional regulator
MPESTKVEALKLIEQMPDDVSLEDILYELYFRGRVERGLDQARRGETVSHEEVLKSVAPWLQSAGQ